MSLTIPGPPPRVPPLEPDPSGSSSVASGRRAATTAGDVAEWARSHGAPEGWSGNAARAANHALTSLASDLDAAVSAMTRVNAALTNYYDDVDDLEVRRTDLVEEHDTLTQRQQVLATDASSYMPDEEEALRERARTLRNDIDSFVTAIETWQRDLTFAEDAVLETLRASDTPGEAQQYADASAEDVDELFDDLITAGTLPEGAATATPEEMRRWLAENPDAAEALMGRMPSAAHGGLAGDLANALGRAEQDPDALRRFFDGLPPQDASTLAMLYPGALGNQNGVPFAYRADANQVAVAAALGEARGLVDGPAPVAPGDQADHNRAVSEANDRIPLYESILANDRQILLFDPSGDGTLAELHGEIGENTRNVGVYVPGATSDMAGYEDLAARSRGFEDAGLGELAMVTWMGGDLPDDPVVTAQDPGYADDLAPDLADFSRELRTEIGNSGADDGTQTTYMGHSYGGAVVGSAETHGLDADRVLHMGSAGMGAGVDDPGDLPASQSDVDRYSMTAPGDPIGGYQGSDISQNGADPDTFPGATRLHTGDYASGDPVSGLPGHSGVLERESDSWNNALAVLTGGEAETYREPMYDSQYNPYGNPDTRSFQGWGPGGTVEID